MKKKLVTADDYRHDRDYWKRRALKQQQVIDTIRTHNNRLGNAERAASSALEHFREKLKAICSHNAEFISRETDWGDVKLYHCDYCFSYVKREEIKDIEKVAIKK